MIRYAISDADLRQKIGSTWLNKAAKNTAALKAAGAYSKDAVSENWGEVKHVFMKIQGNKCGYCERELEDAAIEHDVEHFRPKSSVKPWHKGAPPSDLPANLGSESELGYYMLAFDYRNYLASCKTCNSTYKNNAFPVARTRTLRGTSPSECAAEKPYLAYPIGAQAEDPESLFTFVGVVPTPVSANARGRAIIAFFGLERRNKLRKERLLIIRSMYLAFTANFPEARAMVDEACKDHAPHASCARAYRVLLGSDLALAKKLAFPD